MYSRTDVCILYTVHFIVFSAARTGSATVHFGDAIFLRSWHLSASKGQTALPGA